MTKTWTYTPPDAEDKGGYLIPETFTIETMAHYEDVPVFQKMLFATERPPLTHRQRVMAWLYGVRWYLTHLGLALVNRCDRDRGDDW